MNGRISLGVVLLALVLAHSATAGQNGQVVREAVLRSEASSQAEAIATLAAQTPVQLVARKGGWYQVKTDAHQTGWLKMLAVRFDAAPEARSADMASLLTASGGGVATGVRGMGDEQLAEEKRPKTPLEKMGSFQPRDQAVKRFAAEGRLSTRSLEYFPDPTEEDE